MDSSCIAGQPGPHHARGARITAHARGRSPWTGDVLGPRRDARAAFRSRRPGYRSLSRRTRARGRLTRSRHSIDTGPANRLTADRSGLGRPGRPTAIGTDEAHANRSVLRVERDVPSVTLEVNRSILCARGDGPAQVRQRNGAIRRPNGDLPSKDSARIGPLVALSPTRLPRGDRTIR